MLVCESRTIWCSLRQQERHFFGAVYQAGDRRWGHVGPASGRADATASAPSGRRSRTSVTRLLFFSGSLEPSVEEKHQRPSEQVKNENHRKNACVFICAARYSRRFWQVLLSSAEIL